MKKSTKDPPLGSPLTCHLSSLTATPMYQSCSNPRWTMEGTHARLYGVGAVKASRLKRGTAKVNWTAKRNSCSQSSHEQAADWEVQGLVLSPCGTELTPLDSQMKPNDTLPVHIRLSRLFTRSRSFVKKAAAQKPVPAVYSGTSQGRDTATTPDLNCFTALGEQALRKRYPQELRGQQLDSKRLGPTGHRQNVIGLKDNLQLTELCHKSTWEQLAHWHTHGK